STLSSDSIDYKDFAAPQQFALVMGNEGNGISENMAQQANHLVHISMPGQAESLNVAVAAGILLLHLIAQVLSLLLFNIYLRYYAIIKLRERGRVTRKTIKKKKNLWTLLVISSNILFFKN